MWGVMWGAPVILKVGVPRLLGSMRDTNLRECLAGKVLGERSDPSRGPAFSLSSPTGVGHSGIFIAQATGPTPRTCPVWETAYGSATVGGRGSRRAGHRMGKAAARLR
jgi:hypothetical protein